VVRQSTLVSQLQSRTLSQALRVIVVVHLLLASPWPCTLGRALVVLATTLSVVGLSSIVGLRGTGILQTLRVVSVQFLADERLLALGASRVVLAAALAV
jgi:type III secretory pathway component EscS